MKKNLFLKLSMLLFVLGLSVNGAWAGTPETDNYWAQMTLKPSTVTAGQGKVFVTTDGATYSSIEDVTDEWAPTSTAGGSISTFIEIEGGADVRFEAFAKPDWGYYLEGWSYTDGGADIYYNEDERYESHKVFYLTASNKKGQSNAKTYTVYATFQPIQIVSYEFTEQNVTPEDDGDGHWTCTQTVVFHAVTPDSWGLASMDDVAHFKLPTVTKKSGTAGTWSTIEEWNMDEDPEIRSMAMNGNYADIKVPVTFSINSNDPGEFSAMLTLETMAGMKMTVPLVARITGHAGEAVRYSESSEPVWGELSTLLNGAVAGDVIKLNNDYSNPVVINKNITLDLNGYTLGNTLTISGGDVILAHSNYDGSTITGNVSVTAGKLTLNGGLITDEAQVSVSAGAELVLNGAIVKAPIVNNGTVTTKDGDVRGGLVSYGNLTVDGGFFLNEWDLDAPAITIEDGTATVRRGTIGGNDMEGTCGYGVLVNGGTATVEKLAVVVGSEKALKRTAGTLIVNNGKFHSPAMLVEGAITFNAGYFRYNDDDDAAAALGKPIWRNTVGAEYREGYEFFAGEPEGASVSICRINTTSYSSLEEALAYANNNPQKTVTIFMENDYTLPAGYYTIPANATLVIPYFEEQRAAYPTVEKIVKTGQYSNYTPYAFRRLTFADGVYMSILGTLEVGGAQYCINGQPEQAIPCEGYGHLIMKPGSHITINSGGELRAWGYVTGDGTRDENGTYLSGEIDARRGSVVRESFQMGDWKGGSNSLALLNLSQYTHLFPVYEYFIQNIEAPVKYHPGSSLMCATSVVVGGSLVAYTNNIKVVGVQGEAAMFLMDEKADAENTWVRKWYDVNKDQQVYEINSGAQLGSLVIDLGEIPAAIYDPGNPEMLNIKLDSRKFVLPLTSNFKIHLLSGNMEFTQSTSCLPGMEVEVDKESVISIVKNASSEVVSGGLYFYDYRQWGAFVQSGRYGAIVHYSATLNAQPTVHNISSAEALGDAKLIVHGTFQVASGCAVYTTAQMHGSINKTGTEDELIESLNALTVEPETGGASITSTNADAGNFVFNANVPDFDGVQIPGPGEEDVHFGASILAHYDPANPTPLAGTAIFDLNVCSAARLKNGEGAEHAYSETAGTVAGKSYCYMNNQWTLMDVDEDDECFMIDNFGEHYAKPADYVQLANHKTENADHTYSSATGDRTFILINEEGECQWWEVEKKDNLYHCIHPNNDTYYYWDSYHWVEKRFTITWKNWDGTEIKSYDYSDPDDPQEIEYSVTYGTMAEFLGSNPTREANIDYTYDFTGWTPALGPVTRDVTYTATFSEQPRKYTIVFQTEGGVEIERQFLLHNEVPVCQDVPTRTGFILQWTPAIAAVNGDATYTATWLEEPPTEYEITFYDYDGEILQQGNVAVNAMPAYEGATPNRKPATSEFTYEFDHWSPEPEIVSATSIKSYTAVYSEVAKTYTIYYYKEDGTTLISTEELAWGATPTPPTVSKENPESGYTYTLVWKTLDESSTIQTVMASASYKPTYEAEENRYTRYSVVLSTNMPAACTLIGAGTYDKNESVTIQAIPADGYEFVEWQETHNTNANLGPQTITADIELTAIVQEEGGAPVTDLVIPADGSVTLDAAVTKQDLIITSDGVHSGELFNAGYLTLTGQAYFDLNINAQANTWYTVAVPWPVEVNSGILVGDATQHIGSDFELLTYNSEGRALHGKTGSNWIFATGSDIMQPGTLYMILFNHNASTIRFRKKDGESILTTTLSVQAHPQSTGNIEDAGWNGIANPALFHAYVDASSNTYLNLNFGQKYLPYERRYDAVNMALAPMIVGEPIFVQVADDKDITVTTSNPFSAPVRRAKVDNSYYEVHISAGANYTDRIYLQTLEDKEDTYVIGLDLAKAGVSSIVAQMWVNRYGSKLCVNTTAPKGTSATYPLGIQVPADGEYQIYTATEMQEGQEMYVTLNGRAIWNLAYGPYEVSLTKGTHTEYGLKLVQAPAVVTGVEQITNDQSPIQKVLIDNQIYIIREGVVYTINGQQVK